MLEKKLEVLTSTTTFPKTPDKIPKSLCRLDDISEESASIPEVDPADKKF